MNFMANFMAIWAAKHYVLRYFFRHRNGLLNFMALYGDFTAMCTHCPEEVKGLELTEEV